MPKDSAMLVALATVLIVTSARSTESPTEIAAIRSAAARALVSGCVAAIVDPAVKAYMQRAAEAGKPFGLEQVARLEMTSTPEWRTIMAPAIQKGCECAMAEELEAISRAQSSSEIERINSLLIELTRDRSLSESRMKAFETCFEPLLEATKK
ncbi:MAG: hypothetical protein Q7T57_02440 [Dehalococcoidales bacterium]|nr:hypothetical protein [Dehalococcoidales bacterium]